MKNLSMRILKEKVREILSNMNLEDVLTALKEFPRLKTINTLFGFILSPDENLKWKSVVTFGALVSELAEHDMEAARIIIRRLMWSLNDESGGIGWGAPEAMGETLALHGELAQEYAPILISYLREDGNFLEPEILQRGTLWAIGRLAAAWPELTKPAARYIRPFLHSSNVQLRGHAVLALRGALDEDTINAIELLTEDESEFTIFEAGRMKRISVREAVRRIKIGSIATQ